MIDDRGSPYEGGQGIRGLLDRGGEVLRDGLHLGLGERRVDDGAVQSSQLREILRARTVSRGVASMAWGRREQIRAPVRTNFDRPSTFTWLSTSTYTSVSSMISSPVRKSTSASGAHKVISRRQRSRAAESIGESPHRHAIELASRRWRGGRRMTPRRRPGPAAAAAEARNHQRGVPRHTNDVGATPGAPRPCPTIVRHAAPPFSNFHRTRSEPPPFRPKTAQNLQKNHPPP